MSLPGYVFLAQQCTTLEMRLFAVAAAAGGTAQIQIAYYPCMRPSRRKGILAADLTLTFSGSTTAGLHPVTGLETSGLTWYEASAEAATLRMHADAINAFSSATGRELWYLLDPLGYGRVYVAVLAMTGVTRVAIGMRCISSP